MTQVPKWCQDLSLLWVAGRFWRRRPRVAEVHFIGAFRYSKWFNLRMSKISWDGSNLGSPKNSRVSYYRHYLTSKTQKDLKFICSAIKASHIFSHFNDFKCPFLFGIFQPCLRGSDFHPRDFHRAFSSSLSAMIWKCSLTLADWPMTIAEWAMVWMWCNHLSDSISCSNLC